MNNLIVSNNEAKMTSLELVDFINDQRINENEPVLHHKNFLAKVPLVLGIETSAKFSADLPDVYGRPRKGYKFKKREACLMAMSYSYDLQAKVFDRMTEMEDKQVNTLPDFNNPVIAARAWADAKESEQKALVALEGAKPAIEFVERYTQSTGDKGFRSVCKLLKANENKFREFLLNEKILYRLDGNLTPYGNHIDAGRFAISTGISDSEHAYTQAKFTPKGINWVAGLWAVYNLKG